MPSKKIKLQRKRQHEQHEPEHHHSDLEHQEGSKTTTVKMTNGVGAMHGVVDNGLVDPAANIPLPVREPSPFQAATPPPVPDPITQASALKEQGNAAFKAKQYGDAIDFYTKAIALHPTEPTYLTNRAASHMAIKHFRDALADCQAAVSLQSQPAGQSSSSHPPPPTAIPPKTLIRLAKCHLALGNPVPALSTLRTALSGTDTDATTIAAIHEVERAALRMETHLTRFTAARSAGDWGLARLALDRAAQECEGGEPVEWRCWRVEVELAGGRIAGAMTAVNEAFQLDKKSPDVLCVRALVLFISSKLPAATQHAQFALTYDPDHVRARTLLRRIREVERLKEEGNVAFRGEKWGEAVGRYGDAMEVVGVRDEEAKGGAMRAVLLANRGAAYVKMERHGEAMADTNASLVLVPTSYKALRTRARIHVALEDYEAAVIDFKTALEQVRVEGSEVEERRMKEELRGAEVALKRSKTKDYYKILGISKDSGEHEIKKAYRKQSLLHHPDKGGDEEKFKLASEAYNVLSDPQKRRRYDAGEDDLEGMTGMGSASDFSDLFAGGGFSFGGFASEGGGGARFHGHHHHTRGGFPF